MLSELGLASLARVMIHELRDPSYCHNLGTFFKIFLLIILFFVGYLISLLNILLLNLVSTFLNQCLLW